ncbi:IclR family transcriptional regulator C-terminal domain-containing protein [Virgibacillus halophilus]|uniref:IclR family transcriptional regulator C-terminal domain-containing protein n=1 Tax=Tigheibacillus halophilus TaxID=361280 RepID=A0ABU5C2S4_9BACI|nr:IclR family transcriptional regulator C-terminal domain-containing protein [Virgibacillus halophilus]
MSKKHTEHTILDVNEMLDHLKEVRQNGYAYSDSEIDDGVVSYGIPIFESPGKIVASLSIAGPKERMLKKDKSEIIQAIETAKKMIESQL